VHPEHPSLAPAVASADVDGAARLFRLAKLAEELASSQIADEARQLAGRISEGRFYVACIGQFKRGKSTLINALIGDPVLPVGFTPVTAVPTVIRFGNRRAREFKLKTVPGRKLTYPISISTYRRNSTQRIQKESRRRSLPVQFVIGRWHVLRGYSRPRIDIHWEHSGNAGIHPSHRCGVGRDRRRSTAGRRRVGAGGNGGAAGTESHSGSEQSGSDNSRRKGCRSEFCGAAMRRRLQRSAGPILEVSAAQQIEHRGPERDWQKLVDALAGLVAESGRQLLDSACERGSADSASNCWRSLAKSETRWSGRSKSPNAALRP